MTQELTIRGNQSIALSPQDIVTNASTQAKLLMDIVDKTHCFQIISGKKYLQVEAWETIGAFNSVHAITESIIPIIREGTTLGYDAKVNLVNRDGITVGGAIMPCYFTENACKGKEGDAKDKASKSAAQTFATSKAYRMNYSYVAILAGYEPTPAEEMAGDEIPHDKIPNEHWCEKHHTKFFKTEKMKVWAHTVKNPDGSPTLNDNGKPLWCSEKPQPKTEVQSATTTSEGHARQDIEEQDTGNLPKEAEEAPKIAPQKPKRDPKTIKNIEQLAKALKDDFHLSYADQWKELNIKAWTELAITPAEAYQQVAVTRTG